jgi:hypothetical protein
MIFDRLFSLFCLGAVVSLIAYGIALVASEWSKAVAVAFGIGVALGFVVAQLPPSRPPK